MPPLHRTAGQPPPIVANGGLSYMSINLAKPMETVEQFPFVPCAWPSFADQAYITNYRI